VEYLNKYSSYFYSMNINTMVNYINIPQTVLVAERIWKGENKDSKEVGSFAKSGFFSILQILCCQIL